MILLSPIFAIIIGLILVTTFLSVISVYDSEGENSLALLTGFVGFVNIGLAITLFVLVLVAESVIAISIIGGLAIIAVLVLWLLHIFCAVDSGLGWLGWLALFADIVCTIGLIIIFISGLI